MSITAEEARLAQHDAIEDVKVEAWYMDDSTQDQRLPHKLKPCSAEALADIGVLAWTMNADAYPEDPKLKAVRKVRGYDYEDIVDISPDKLAGYEDKIKMFYEEHIHSDEEIRYVLEGSGYFDVRDKEDRWIRIWTKKGDMVALPEGIYHRFTLDENNYIKALRLFCGVPIWTPYNRPQEEHPSRVKYAQEYGIVTPAA